MPAFFVRLCVFSMHPYFEKILLNAMKNCSMAIAIAVVTQMMM